VVDDPAGAGRLGDLNGDLMPFVVAIDDAPFIVCAGAVLGPGASRVELTSSGFSGVHQTCWVRNQVWMSFPEPFVEGMGITATWYDDERMLFQCQSGPLHADRLEPIFGPDWTSYAPA
jgi:hypothetical protein